MNKLNKITVSVLTVITLMNWSCEKDNQDTGGGEEIFTEDITNVSQFFSFASGEFVSTYDIVFSLRNMSYIVELNSAAGVQAIVDTSSDFDTAILPDTSYLFDTTGFYVIGDSWMDTTTYNSVDHSIQSNGNVYFIRSADYEWIKFSVISGSPTEFSIKYAIRQEDGIFGGVRTAAVSYSEDSPAYFEFSNGLPVEPEGWDLGFLSISVYAPGAGLFYMPAVHMNYNRGVVVTILVNTNFDDVLSVPADVDWLSDGGELRNLGYLGTSEVLVYHPEPPYNHKVLLENPGYIYLFKTNESFYKLQFLEYSTGVVLFKFAQL